MSIQRGSSVCSVEGCDNFGRRSCTRAFLDNPYGKNPLLCSDHLYHLCGVARGGGNGNANSCRACLKRMNQNRQFPLAAYWKDKDGLFHEEAISKGACRWILTDEIVTKEDYSAYESGQWYHNEKLYYDFRN